MRVITERRLPIFWEQHAEARGPLEAWLEHVRRAEWTMPSDVQKDYGDDVILPNNRAVFNIKGNKYRLVVHIHYKSQILFVRFIGTHTEYDHIDVAKI